MHRRGNYSHNPLEPVEGRVIGQKTSDCPHCCGERIWRKRSKVSQFWHRYCKSCHQSRGVLSKRKGARRTYERMKRRAIEEPVFRATLMWRGARTRAKRRKMEFSLDLSRMLNALLSGRCEVTGLPFDLTFTRSQGVNPFSPSLDRKDATKGYTNDNVQITCWIYNRAKAAGTHEDVVKLARALAEKEIA